MRSLYNAINARQAAGSCGGRARQPKPVFTADASVPEPASWALMIAGFGLMGIAMRRRTAVAA